MSKESILDGLMLRNDCLEYYPIWFDFGYDYEGDISQGYRERWEIAGERTDEEIENDEYVPMMNYLYPLPEGFSVPDDWKEKVVCTTLIYLIDEDRYYLALTGGGMDLRWQICESYINLGYLPPSYFCELPILAGKDYESERNRIIVEACKRSCEWHKGWLERRKERLERLGQ